MDTNRGRQNYMDINRGQTKLHGHKQGADKITWTQTGGRQNYMDTNRGQTKPNRVIRFTMLHVEYLVHMGLL